MAVGPSISFIRLALRLASRSAGVSGSGAPSREARHASRFRAGCRDLAQRCGFTIMDPLELEELTPKPQDRYSAPNLALAQGLRDRWQRVALLGGATRPAPCSAAGKSERGSGLFERLRRLLALGWDALSLPSSSTRAAQMTEDTETRTRCHPVASVETYRDRTGDLRLAKPREAGNGRERVRTGRGGNACSHAGLRRLRLTGKASPIRTRSERSGVFLAFSPLGSNVRSSGV
jgi:hypothetical protein